jgi:hypothetical protein
MRPSHIESLKNMVTGSISSEAALLVIDVEGGHPRKLAPPWLRVGRVTRSLARHAFSPHSPVYIGRSGVKHAILRQAILGGSARVTVDQLLLGACVVYQSASE